MTTCLGIDVGSTTTKVSLVSISGSVREAHVERCATADDADALMRGVGTAVRACVRRAVSPIAAIGVASMAETGVPMDAAGRPLTPLLRWNRSSGGSAIDEVLRRHPDLPAHTGIPASPKPTLVTLTELRTDQPEIVRSMTRWSGVADLVVAALTGAHVTDHTLAARTMMAAGGGWDAELVAETGIGKDVLPRILSPEEPAARTDDRAAAFDLGRGIPVFVAGHDHAVGAWAAGVRSAGQVADSLGTAEAVIRIAAEVDVAAATADGFSVGRTVDGRGTTVLGGNPACGALLAHWPDGRAGPSPIDVLRDADAGAWRTSPITIAPYPSGRQCPCPDPGAALVMPESADHETLARALLQAIVLQARWMRETIDTHARAPGTAVTLLGSLATLVPVWGPLTAAAAGLDLHRAVAAEPVATGAALLAAVRAGLAPEDTVLPTLAVIAADAPGIGEAYRRFLAVVGSDPIRGDR